MASYFNLTKYLSYNALLTFVIGFRSAGKTYAFKDWALRTWIKDKKQFVYLRRYQVECDATKKTLFDDIAPKYDLDIKVEGDIFYARPHYDDAKNKTTDPETGKEVKDPPEPWEICGYSFSLTSFAKYKSASFADVDKICFDEFLIENKNSHYLRDEVNALASVYHTIARRNRVRLVAFANSSDIVNPYFENYHIRLGEFKRSNTIYRNDKTVLFVYYKNKEAQQELLNSEQGKAFGESFASYAFKGDFIGDDNVGIAPMPHGAQYNFNLTDNEYTVSVYIAGNRIWIGSKPKGGVTFTTATDDLEHVLNTSIISYIKNRCLNSAVLFENSTAKLKFIDIMKL